MKHVENQNFSDLSRKKWCDANNVNFNTLAYWIGQFKKESTPSESNKTKWAMVVPNGDSTSNDIDILSVSIV